MAAAPKTREEVRRRAKADGIEFFFAQFVDMNGKPSAKLVPVEHLDALFEDGAGFAGFAAGDIGHTPASPDIAGMPDPATYTPVPFKPGLARLACDITVDGDPWAFCPRTILRNALARTEQAGYRLKCGIELEFFLLREDENGQIALADPLDTLDKPCYDMRALTRVYDLVAQISRNLNTLGWNNYANDHEDANGQFEINFAYDDALTTADKAIFFRYMVHAMAQERGLLSTFMPKPFSHLTGNGAHLHISLWDKTGKKNLFEDPKDPRGLGLSKTAYHFLGGVIKHMEGATALFAPSVNSYKRMGVGAPTSGATWAPAYATYGMNNRTQAIRIPAPGRIEIRAVDGAANPYLATAALLACGMDGIENKTDPGEPNLENLYTLTPEQIRRRRIKTLPANLLDAVRATEKCKPLRDWLGELDGRSYVDYFCEVKRNEWQDFHTQVTDWELRRYLNLV